MSDWAPRIRRNNFSPLPTPGPILASSPPSEEVRRIHRAVLRRELKRLRDLRQQRP
jgi:hypothetical protein